MDSTYENGLREQAKAYVAAGGTWQRLAQKIAANPTNLSAWARGGPGLVAKKKLAKIPAALVALGDQLSKGANDVPR